MSFFHFLKFVMNFLKGVVSICLSCRNTGQAGRIIGFDRCFQVVDRPQSNIVTLVLAKAHFKVLSATHGETKTENIYHCSNVCESCRQFISTNLLKNQ